MLIPQYHTISSYIANANPTISQTQNTHLKKKNQNKTTNNNSPKHTSKQNNNINNNNPKHTSKQNNNTNRSKKIITHAAWHNTHSQTTRTVKQHAQRYGKWYHQFEFNWINPPIPSHTNPIIGNADLNHTNPIVVALWFVVYGLWFMVCGLWFMICGLWFVICGLWFMIRWSRMQLCTILYSLHVSMPINGIEVNLTIY